MSKIQYLSKYTHSLIITLGKMKPTAILTQSNTSNDLSRHAQIYKAPKNQYNNLNAYSNISIQT